MAEQTAERPTSRQRRIVPAQRWAPSDDLARLAPDTGLYLVGVLRDTGRFGNRRAAAEYLERVEVGGGVKSGDGVWWKRLA